MKTLQDLKKDIQENGVLAEEMSSKTIAGMLDDLQKMGYSVTADELVAEIKMHAEGGESTAGNWILITEILVVS